MGAFGIQIVAATRKVLEHFGRHLRKVDLVGVELAAHKGDGCLLKRHAVLDGLRRERGELDFVRVSSGLGAQQSEVALVIAGNNPKFRRS